MKFFFISLLILFSLLLGMEGGYLVGVFRSSEKHCEPIKDRAEYSLCRAQFQMMVKK